MGSRGDGSLLGRELWPPPSDAITKLRFSSFSDRLLVSSWDSVSASSRSHGFPSCSSVLTVVWPVLSNVNCEGTIVDALCECNLGSAVLTMLYGCLTWPFCMLPQWLNSMLAAYFRVIQYLCWRHATNRKDDSTLVLFECRSWGCMMSLPVWLGQNSVAKDLSSTVASTMTLLVTVQVLTTFFAGIYD